MKKTLPRPLRPTEQEMDQPLLDQEVYARPNVNVPLLQFAYLPYYVYEPRRFAQFHFNSRIATLKGQTPLTSVCSGFIVDHDVQQACACKPATNAQQIELVQFGLN